MYGKLKTTNLQICKIFFLINYMLFKFYDIFVINFPKINGWFQYTEESHFYF